MPKRWFSIPATRSTSISRPRSSWALGYGEALVAGAFDFQLVRQTINWRSPARFDQVLQLTVFAKHVGTTSFTLFTEFRIASEERIIADCETVYVLVDSRTLQKMPISDELRFAFERGAPGAVTDHAGYFRIREGRY